MRRSSSGFGWLREGSRRPVNRSSLGRYAASRLPRPGAARRASARARGSAAQAARAHPVLTGAPAIHGRLDAIPRPPPSCRPMQLRSVTVIFFRTMRSAGHQPSPAKRERDGAQRRVRAPLFAAQLEDGVRRGRSPDLRLSSEADQRKATTEPGGPGPAESAPWMAHGPSSGHGRTAEGRSGPRSSRRTSRSRRPCRSSTLRCESASHAKKAPIPSPASDGCSRFIPAAQRSVLEQALPGHHLIRSSASPATPSPSRA